MKFLRAVEAERRNERFELRGRRFFAHVARAFPDPSLASKNAVTKIDIAGVTSAASRTRWMALSSGSVWTARLASILARNASPVEATCSTRIIATEDFVTTQSQ